jgi:hypothetical protein
VITPFAITNLYWGVVHRGVLTISMTIAVIFWSAAKLRL